jgi:riboflavin kinase/FMN adenylyltransferase
LIAALVDSANQQNAPAVVLTFFPHPAVILKHIESPYYLSTPDEKADQLAKLGVDI